MGRRNTYTREEAGLGKPVKGKKRERKGKAEEPVRGTEEGYKRATLSESRVQPYPPVKNAKGETDISHPETKLREAGEALVGSVIRYKRAQEAVAAASAELKDAERTHEQAQRAYERAREELLNPEPEQD